MLNSHSEPHSAEQQEKKKKSKLRENIETVLSAIVIALLVRIFIIEAYEIPTGSMIPTLIEGDRLLVNKFVYGVRIPIVGWKLPKFRSPERGDITVFYYPKYKSPGAIYEFVDLVTFGLFRITNTGQNPKNFIKRTIGLPGDVLSFQNQELKINDKKIDYKNMISDKLYEKLKTIRSPEKDTARIISDIDHYYFKGNNGYMRGYGNEYLRMEKVGKVDHIIQLSNPKSHNPATDIPFLYIPKSGDDLELEVKEDEHTNKVVSIKVNGAFKGIVSNEDYNTFYRKIFDNTDILTVHGTLKKKIDADYYFMMGDNRDLSSDSRSWGFVHEKYIIGHPLIIYWPYKRLGMIPE